MNRSRRACGLIFLFLRKTSSFYENVDRGFLGDCRILDSFGVRLSNLVFGSLGDLCCGRLTGSRWGREICVNITRTLYVVNYLYGSESNGI